MLRGTYSVSALLEYNQRRTLNFSTPSHEPFYHHFLQLKMKNIVLICALILAVSAAAFGHSKADSSSAKAPTTKMTGYVVDASCAKDMAESPSPMDSAAAHTKKCALQEMCQASGYGLFSDGKWYKFDANGDAKATAFIKKTTKKDHLMVDVSGTLKDGKFTLASIKKHKSSKSKKKST
jgi:hypothetical protein